jgi:medium-chain acyl-[acyl-carrier-protein] hydrolase
VIRDDVEMRGLRLPGRESRLEEPPFEHLPDAVDQIAHQVEELVDLPLAFVGVCAGAIVMFEVARELRRRGVHGPQLLIVGAQLAPALRALRAPKVNEDVWERVRRLGGTDPAVLENPALMKLIEPVLRADFALTDNYVYNAEAPLPCAITAVLALDDSINLQQVERWKEETTGPFRVRTIPADHFFSGPAWLALATIADEELSGLVGRFRR